MSDHAEIIRDALAFGLEYHGHELDDVTGRVHAVTEDAKKFDRALAALDGLLADHAAENERLTKAVESQKCGWFRLEHELQEARAENERLLERVRLLTVLKDAIGPDGPFVAVGRTWAKGVHSLERERDEARAENERLRIRYGSFLDWAIGYVSESEGPYFERLHERLTDERAALAAAQEREDDAEIARVVRERDAADTGERITLDEALAESGITREQLAAAQEPPALNIGTEPGQFPGPGLVDVERSLKQAAEPLNPEHYDQPLAAQESPADGSDVCGHYFAPPYPQDYRFCYQPKGHDGEHVFEVRRG